MNGAQHDLYKPGPFHRTIISARLNSAALHTAQFVKARVKIARAVWNQTVALFPPIAGHVPERPIGRQPRRRLHVLLAVQRAGM
jgi:hypothetical protein